MSNTCVISLENICKSFGGVKVLNNVDFNLIKGEVHALVGGNGAGKSTLMKILNGAYTKDSGTIKVNGKEVEYQSIKDAWKCGIRMIYQELSLSPTLTVTENIFLAREEKKGFLLDKKSMRSKTAKLLEDLQIDAKPDDLICDLSVGTCQLIEIAKALSTDANVLILDEPTASLTDRETKILFDRIEDLKAKGISIVYISHRMKEIFKVSDRISVLKDGNMILTENTKNMTMAQVISYITAESSKEMVYRPHEIPIDNNEVMFSVEHLSVDNVVKDVSFSIKKGEVLGIAGLMGSGRTETAEAIFGIRKASKNTKMVLDGKEIINRSASEGAKNGFALIPEDRRREGLVLQHTVEQNMCLTNMEKLRKSFLLSNRKARKFTQNAISNFAIKALGPDVYAYNLSGGNQQKIVIAKWIETQPKLLIMDEPTAGVDVGAKGEIVDIVRTYVSEGHSCLFISSEMSELMAVCDRIIVYCNGKITDEFDRRNITDEEILEHAIQK